MKWNQLFSHNTRRQEGTADSLLRLLAPSLLGMAVCVLTLCSLTWAWFNMAVGSSITGIQSSEVEVCLVTKTTDQTTSTTTWAATTPLVANDDAKETTPDSEKKIYFIARGTAANAYLAVVYNDTTTYYGPLNLTQEPDTNGYYPVYSITLNDASPVNVSLHWGTLPESITPSETQATTVSVPWGGTSTQAQEEASNTPPVAYAPQLQPETPAKGATGDNSSDANKEPDATGGNTSGTGETGTTGDGSTSGSTDTGNDPDSSTEKGSAEKSDGDTTLDGSVVKAAAD